MMTYVYIWLAIGFIATICFIVLDVKNGSRFTLGEIVGHSLLNIIMGPIVVVYALKDVVIFKGKKKK